METMTQSPEQLFDCEVTDSEGNKLGTIDGVWIDDATNQLEFLGVKTGWLLGKTHVIPAANARIGDGTIEVPYSEDQIKGAPSFGTNTELTPDQEDDIYGYFGLDRSTSSSPTGLATGEDVSDPGTTDLGTSSTAQSTTDFGPSGLEDVGPATAGTSTAGYDTTATGDIGTNTGYTTDLSTGDEERVQLHEENLDVGKRAVEAGRAKVRKVVRTEHVSQPVDLAREEVHVERVPASGEEVAGNAFQEGQIDVPVTREEPVVAKEAHATGEVLIGKTSDTETRTVEGDVRREDVEVDRGSGFENTP